MRRIRIARPLSPAMREDIEWVERALILCCAVLLICVTIGAGLGLAVRAFHFVAGGG